MKYNCKPIYKYLIVLFLISLFIFHQKTTMDGLKILILSLTLTLFFLVMDFAFIQDHPGLLQDNIKYKKSKKLMKNTNINNTKGHMYYTKDSTKKSQYNNEEYDIEYDDYTEQCSTCNNTQYYNMYDDIKATTNPYRTPYNPDNDPRYNVNQYNENMSNVANY